VADHQDRFEFSAVEAKDIIDDRRAEWSRFTGFVTWGVGLAVLALLGLLVFVA
jgi:hypothetical protein